MIDHWCAGSPGQPSSAAQAAKVDAVLRAALAIAAAGALAPASWAARARPAVALRTE